MADSNRILNFKIEYLPNSIFIQWEMNVDDKKLTWSHDRLELRLYCDPVVHFKKPTLLFDPSDEERTQGGAVSAAPLGFGAEKSQTLLQKFDTTGSRVDKNNREYNYITFNLKILKLTSNDRVIAKINWEVLTPFHQQTLYKCLIEIGFYRDQSFIVVDNKSEQLKLPLIDESSHFDITKYLRLAHQEFTDFKALDMTAPRKLKDIFVSRELQQVSPSHIISYETETNSGENNRSIMLEKALRLHRRVVVIANLGSGKTTLLRHFSLRIAEGNLDTLAEVPIYLELKRFVDSNDTELFSYILNILQKKYGIPTETKILEELINKRKFILLLDGLDETKFGETQDNARKNYENVVDSINDFVTRFPHIQIVITARKSGWQDRLISFYVYELPPFDIHQAFNFIDNWFKFSNTSNQVNPEGLKHALLNTPRLSDLARNPLLLLIIILIYMQSPNDLPVKRVTLYERGIEILLAEWDTNRNVRRFSKLGINQKIFILNLSFG